MHLNSFQKKIPNGSQIKCKFTCDLPTRFSAIFLNYSFDRASCLPHQWLKKLFAVLGETHSEVKLAGRKSMSQCTPKAGAARAL